MFCNMFTFFFFISRCYVTWYSDYYYYYYFCYPSLHQHLSFYCIFISEQYDYVFIFYIYNNIIYNYINYKL